MGFHSKLSLTAKRESMRGECKIRPAPFLLGNNLQRLLIILQRIFCDSAPFSGLEIHKVCLLPEKTPLPQNLSLNTESSSFVGCPISRDMFPLHPRDCLKIRNIIPLCRLSCFLGICFLFTLELACRPLWAVLLLGDILFPYLSNL